MLGADKAVRAYAACVRSFSLLERRMPELLQLSDYERRPSLYLAVDDSGVGGARARGRRPAIDGIAGVVGRGRRAAAAIWLSSAGRDSFGVGRTGGSVPSGAWRFCRRHSPWCEIFARSRVETIDEAERSIPIARRAYSGRRRARGGVRGLRVTAFLEPKWRAIHNTFALVTEPLEEPARATRLP